MGISVSLEGIGDLIDQIDLEGEAVDEVVGEALNAAADPIVAEAQKTTAFHDRTGNPGKLRKSIGKSKVKRGTNGTKYILVQATDPVAKLVEYGHGGPKEAQAHPFLEPAYNHHEEEAAATITEKLRAARR